MKKYFSLLLVVFLVYSCQKDNNIKRQTDDQGVVIATPYLWKTSLHYGVPTDNSFIKYPIFYKNSIIIPTTSNGSKRNLTAIDIDTGKKLWCWDDSYNDWPEFLDIFYHVMYDNLLIFQLGGRSYCINLDNGSTFWKHRRDRSFRSEIASMGDQFFIFGPLFSDEGTEMAAFIGDIKSGEIVTPKIRVELPDDIDYPDGSIGPKFKGGVLYINNIPDNDQLLVVSHYEVLPDWTFNTYFSLYNAVTEEWIWKKRKIMTDYYGNFFSEPQIYNGRIYANVGCAIVCHDLTTGVQLWKNEFSNDFMFSGFIIEDNKLIANNEDLFACCINPTGTIMWQVNTAGTGGRMSYLNGIVYFAGGSVPRLFAIEASTGKIVWKISTVLLGEPSRTMFKANAVHVIPAKDDKPARVIALSDLYAYCFEAYR